jgi:hypothetical protein
MIMKKINAFIFILLVGFLFQSCNKEELISDDKEGTKLYLSTDYTTEDIVMDFISKMDTVRNNPSYGEAEEWNYDSEEVLWNIEAALNYKYAYPHEERDKMFSYEGSIGIDLDVNQESNIVNLQTGFDAIYAEIADNFLNISASHKFFIGIDIEIDEDNSSESNLQLNYKYFIGKFDMNLPDGDWMITGGDWGAGGLYGGNGTYANYDGSDKLEQEIFAINSLHQVSGVFYVDQAFIGYPYPNTIPYDPNFNFTPFESWFTYSEVYANWLPQYQNSPQTYINQNIMDEYISYLPDVLSYTDAQNTNKRIYIEDFLFSTNTIVIGGSVPHHRWYEGWFYEATSHPRLNDPSQNLYQ